jgi:integrase/recombinase XerC
MANQLALFKVGEVWHFRFQVAGKRTQRSTGETVKARALLIAEKAREDARLRARGQEPCPTLREVAGQWMDCHERIVSDDHWRSVERLARLHLHGLGDVALNRITTAMIEVALHEHLADHKPRSANQWLSILHLLANWAINRKMLEAIPWRVKKLKPQKRPKVTLAYEKTLTWLQAVDALSAQGGIACRLMLFLGLREEEALTARWEHLDWERGTYTPWQTKGREAVALTAPQALLDHLRPRRAALGWIIPGADDKPHAPGFCRYFMKEANRQCGTPGLTPHRLRGTCATRLSVFLPLLDVQRFMRHKDAMTTLGYIEENQVSILQAHEAISQAIVQAHGSNAANGGPENPADPASSK